MGRKKEFVMSKDDLAYEELEHQCFSDGFIEPKGKCVAAFDFSEDTNIMSTAKEAIISPITNEIYDNRRTPGANGSAPPIDGEFLDVKRTYMLRASTVRKINELKSIHHDLNAFVSIIVDTAITEYYDRIVK
ncbi:hypothetical protein [Clostridium cibarium]|uniref:Uncharacterized protein n=1 Tax=Clostridium cibarium TaxID=2762247 RepID=A0ABR8PWE4_9CLOT|nr:hypothetical protein [Clostridium cibarium]MBD7912464.1 hypothetical protein [Clostridium cibarium]